jgi:hypothetical protein
VRALSAEAVPILDHGVQQAAWDGRPFPLPYITLDTTGRPALTDLARVHRLEGAGGRLDSRWVWDGDGAWVILERLCTAPVRARVVLRFNQEPHGLFVERAARTGLFGVDIGQGMLIWETLAGAGALNAFLARRAH